MNSTLEFYTPIAMTEIIAALIGGFLAAGTGWLLHTRAETARIGRARDLLTTAIRDDLQHTTAVFERLEDEQLRAIGHVTAQWAFMESMIDMCLSSRLKDRDLKGDELSFRNRLRIYRESLESTEDTEKAQKLKDVLSNAGSLRDMRHKTIHSKWGRSGEAIDNPNIIEQFGERGGKPYAQFTSAEKLEKLARQISQISSDLMNAIWPDGGPLSPWQRK